MKTLISAVSSTPIDTPDQAVESAATALIFPARWAHAQNEVFASLTWRELEALTDRYAHGLIRCGISRGEHVLILLPLSVDQIAILLALLKLAVVPVFIDPAMGLRLFLALVAEAAPTAIIGVPFVHLLRLACPRPFRSVQRAVTSGRKWSANLYTLSDLRAAPPPPMTAVPAQETDEAAIIFTTGSTGTPKGVVYSASTLRAQLDVMRRDLHVQPDQVHAVGIPIFALFSLALGVTTVIPDTNVLRPSRADPARFVQAIQASQATLSLGSPALWQRVILYCQQNGLSLPSLQHVLVSGAPVSPRLVRDLSALLPNGQVYTPYGATEVLPIAVLRGDEILAETASLSAQGCGICVGRPVSGLQVRVIAIQDGAIDAWSDALCLPPGQMGEVVVQGDNATRQYLPQQYPSPQNMLHTATANNKIPQGADVWHRTGDLGYFDPIGRLWLCGRMSECVQIGEKRLASLMCEGVFNAHPDVARSALVGIGTPEQQRPVIVVETWAGKRPRNKAAKRRLAAALRALAVQHEPTQDIQDFLFYPGTFPVDTRHHAKIRRDVLAQWASRHKAELS